MTAHIQVCTATRPGSDQVYTRTAKTRAIPSLHRDNFLARQLAGTKILLGCFVG
jgi:hypothetical protein